MEGVNTPTEIGSSDRGLLARSRTIAGAGFNRWTVPPAALAIHLCIGMAYGFSVFWLPMTRQLGIDHSIAPPEGTAGAIPPIVLTDAPARVIRAADARHTKANSRVYSIRS